MIRSIFFNYLACFFFLLNIFYNIQVSTTEKEGTVKVKVKLDELTNTVEERFHGFALDSSLFTSNGLRKDINMNNSKRLSSLMKGLAPAYLRVGGTAANWVFFDLPSDPLKSLNYPKANILTRELFDLLVSSAKDNGNRLLFDLNAELRYGKEWNPSDAIRLIEYCIEKNYTEFIDWELGNEPNHISSSGLKSDQVAKDFQNLHKLFSYYKTKGFFKNSKLVGPDVGWMGVNFIGKIANDSGQFLDAYTIHQYYFDGKNATVVNYTDPTNFVKLEKLFDKIRKELKDKKNKNKHWWLGETSDGYNSGTRGVSDKYVSGFLYLEKLGLSAANNVNVVIRQTIFNGDYGICNYKNFTPYPDYWLMWVHHNLVGREVFNVTVEGHGEGPHPTIRVYAHCTKQNHEYKKGEMTVFALNVHPTKIWKLKFENKELNNKNIDSYEMTPENDNILSGKVKLNGEILTLDENENLPIFTKPKTTINEIKLNPRTFGFYVIKDADIEFCKNNNS